MRRRNVEKETVEIDVLQKKNEELKQLKGHPRFGYVKLLKTERSETAAMADLLD